MNQRQHAVLVSASYNKDAAKIVECAKQEKTTRGNHARRR